MRSEFRASSSFRTISITRAATHHSNQDVVERLQPADLKQIATVEAIFVYNAAQRDQMIPRKPLPDPAGEEKRRAPIEGIFPGCDTRRRPRKSNGFGCQNFEQSPPGEKPGGLSLWSAQALYVKLVNRASRPSDYE